MRSARIDRAFARYRTTGDPAQLAIVFDATARELHRLAWHLIGERHAAEDLVQSTFLAAIEAAPTFAQGRDVLPWLCGILANRARDLRRHRRVRAQHTPPPPLRLDLVDPVIEASANELDAVVGRAVRALDEPYRQVLLLHLEHGLGGGEIAEALTRPEATVRSQLQRGLDRLRKALPVGIAGAASAIAPIADLSAVRVAVLAKAGGGAPIVAAAFTTTLLAGTTMKKLLAVGVVVIALLGTWPLWRGDPNAVAPSADGVVAAQADLTPTPSASSTAPSAIGDGAVARTAVAAAPTVLEVEVRWADDTPASGVVAHWTPQVDRGDLWRQFAPTDAAGIARFVDVVPGKAHVGCDRDDTKAWDQVRVAVGQTTRAKLVLPVGRDVDGHVVDELHRPIAGAEIWLGAHAPAAAVVAHSGADGSFVLRGVGRDVDIGAWAEGYVPKGGASWTDDRCTLMLRADAGSVRGTVVDARGAPVADAMVLIGELAALDRADTRGWIRTAQNLPRRTARTDRDGSFRTVGLPRGELAVWAASPMHAAWFGSVTTAEREVTLAITLLEGARVRGNVRDRDGALLANARITASHDADADDEHAGPGWTRAESRSDANGEYVLEHVVPGNTTLRAEHDEDGLAATRTFADGEQQTWDVRFGTGPRIHGTVVDPDGLPLNGWQIQAHGRSGSSTDTDALGHFAIEVEDADYELCLVPTPVDVAALLLHRVHPAFEPLRIVVPWSRIPSARVVGRLCAVDGTAPVDASLEFVQLGDDGTTTSLSDAPGDKTAGIAADGHFRSVALFPGRYLVHASAPMLGTLTAGPFTVSRGALLDVGELQFAAAGKLVVRLARADGAAIAKNELVLLRAEAEPEGVAIGVENGSATTALQPGVWFVSTRAPMAACTRRVEVRPSETTTLDFVVPIGVLCTIEWPPIPHDDYLLHYVWRDASGAIAIDDFGRNGQRSSPWRHDRAIPPGRYTITGEDASGRSATATALVHAAEPPLVILLPIPPAK